MKKFKPGFILLLVVLLFSLVLVQTGEATARDLSELRVGFAIQGGIDWPGWYKQGYDAIVAAQEEYGFHLSVTEMVGFPDMERVFTQYAEEGYDFVWAHASAFEFGVPEVAKNYPDVKWLITGSRFADEDLPNVVTYDYEWRDAAYVWGYLTALMTEAGVVGMTIGEPYDDLVDLAMGVKVGFLKHRPDGEFIYNVAGTWGDPDIGREIALAQADAGADIVTEWAGTTGVGVATAAEERGLLFIAEDQDIGAMNPDVTIGYAYYTFTRVIFDVMANIADDNWQSGSFVFDVSPETLDALDFHMTDLVPAEIQEKVVAEKERMMAAGGVSELYPDISEYAIGDTDAWMD